MAKIILNEVFHTEDNRIFHWVKAEEVKLSGNFITNIEGKVKAFENGKEVDVPKVLYNEVDTPYCYVENFYELGKQMAHKHGVYKAVKSGRIRVYPHATPKYIASVINGVREADGVSIDENSVLVQNVIGGEYYVQQKAYLQKNYKFVRNEGDYDVYDFAGDVQEWVFCDFHVFGALWGGIQFLATPMIRIDNPDDCYGCNFIRFWGDDQTVGTHRTLGFYRACGIKFYPAPIEPPVGIREAKFEPPKTLTN